MGITTGIEWCDSTLNLMMGCNGCELWNPKAGIMTCYAGIMTERYGGRKGWPVTFDQPVTFPERLRKAPAWPDLAGTERPDKPWLNGYPRTIFLDDMGDTFTEDLPLDWLAPHIPLMANSPHIYQFLTKRPGRMFRFFEGLGYIPDNFWLMTSVTGQETVGRVKDLLRLRQINPYIILGLSCEPLLGTIDLQLSAARFYMGKIDWIIGGAESGPSARPCHPDWARGLRDQAVQAGVPFFWKQWGEYLDVDMAIEQDLVDTYNDTCKIINIDSHYYARLGKKIAGRLLDGQTWDQFPVATPQPVVEQGRLF